jgi:hypothetical protein
MIHRKSTTGRLLAAASILGIAVLAACAPGVPANFCHATGDAANPYELVTITGTDAAVHLQHPGDFGPAPVGGCPTTLVPVTNSTIAICHATNDEAAPFTEVAVSVNGLDGHATHVGDFFPVPEGGCPTTPLADTEGKITICHATSSTKNPYNLITVDVNGLNGHDKHPGDIIPAPAEGCPVP